MTAQIEIKRHHVNRGDNMKSIRLLAVLIALLCSLSMVSCLDNPTQQQPPSEPASTLENTIPVISKSPALAYEVLDVEIQDTPMKAGVSAKVLITAATNEINKDSLKELLLYIHSNTMARKGWKYEKATTISATWAYLTREHVPNAQWIAMIDQGPGDAEAQISYNERQLTNLNKPPETKHRLSEEKRKEIFHASFIAARNARIDAEKKYPSSSLTNMATIGKFSALQDKLEKKYKRKVVKKYNLTRKQLEDIVIEGFMKSWPEPQ